MRKGEITRSKFIDIAIGLFATQGIHGVSFQDIAKKINLSQPSMYKYFRDKDDLIIHCCQFSAEHGRQFIDHQIADGKSVGEKFRLYVESNLKWVIQHPRYASMLLAMYYLGTANPQLKDLHFDINEVGIARISSYLTALRDFKNKREVRATAGQIHNLLSGAMIKALHWGSTTPKETWKAVWKLT